MNEIIKLNNINKIFKSDEIETKALDNVSLSVFEGDYMSISGPSGSGKSTLLSILGLLDTASSGDYHLSGHLLAQISKEERARIRNKEIGFVFQSFNLISDLTVAENVVLPLTYRKDVDKNERKQWVEAALASVDMLHRQHHYPSQLSGGQQQRVAVARAIAGRPSVILADEPTGNLDSKNAEAVMQLLEKLHQQGSTICIVTHDPKTVSRTQRRVEVSDGKIVADTINSLEARRLAVSRS